MAPPLQPTCTNAEARTRSGSVLSDRQHVEATGDEQTARVDAGSVSGNWQEVSVAKEDRGFASMDRAKQREIASKGGKAAHQKGTAHEWTSEEAREAGRKGGMASHRRKQEARESGTPSGSGVNETDEQG